MSFKYLTNKHSFDSIVDPYQTNWADYWYLQSRDYQTYTWSNDIFNEEELEKIIIVGKRLTKERAQTGGHGEDCLDIRRSHVSWITINDYTKFIYSKISQAVNDTNEKFFNFDLTMLERLQFTEYSSNELGFYEQHVDPLVWCNPHNRKLSFVLQLSDPSEYEGGELKLYTAKDPIVIKKTRGLAVFFPSYVLHEVTPVTEGTRHSLVGWVHGPSFK